MQSPVGPIARLLQEVHKSLKTIRAQFMTVRHSYLPAEILFLTSWVVKMLSILCPTSEADVLRRVFITIPVLGKRLRTLALFKRQRYPLNCVQRLL